MAVTHGSKHVNADQLFSVQCQICEAHTYFQNCDEACNSVPIASQVPIYKRQFHEQTVRVGLVICERA